MEHKIDAKGKPIGRIATEVASLLMGKNTPGTFKRNQVNKDIVRVVNVAQIAIDPKKALQKTYHSHSGYPGGDKRPNLKHIIATKGIGDALKRAINGMLPKNTLREKRLKQLVIED